MMLRLLAAIGVLAIALLGLLIRDQSREASGCTTYNLPTHYIGLHYEWIDNDGPPFTRADVEHQKRWEKANGGYDPAMPMEKFDVGDTRFQLLMSARAWIVVPGWGDSTIWQGEENDWDGRKTAEVTACGPPPSGTIGCEGPSPSYLLWPDGRRDEPTRICTFEPPGTEAGCTVDDGQWEFEVLGYLADPVHPLVQGLLGTNLFMRCSSYGFPGRVGIPCPRDVFRHMEREGLRWFACGPGVERVPEDGDRWAEERLPPEQWSFQEDGRLGSMFGGPGDTYEELP